MINFAKFKQHALAAHAAIHAGESHATMPSGARVAVTATRRQRIPLVRLTDFQPFDFQIPSDVHRRGGTRNVRVHRVEFLAQNPDTASRFAEMARRGHTITWITFNGLYTRMGVIDGVFVRDMRQYGQTIRT